VVGGGGYNFLGFLTKPNLFRVDFLAMREDVVVQ
jgi:hypothetical protein